MHSNSLSRRQIVGGLTAGLAAIVVPSALAQAPASQARRQKACNVSFTKSLAKQLAPKGIRVKAVAPGPYWTPLQVSCGKKPKELTNFGKDTPMGRGGQPAELAAPYVLLASQESSYATDQVYGASGGGGNT